MLVEYSSVPDVRLVSHLGNDFDVVAAARVSTGVGTGEGEVGEGQGLINYLMKHRHGTPFEHNQLRFFVDAPIFVWREWHRHRIGVSYNEESGRYKVLRPKFYIPNPDRPAFQVENWVPSRPKFDVGDLGNVVETMKKAYQVSYEAYLTLLEARIDPGLARDVLPVGIYSRCWVTFNLRSAFHFLSLRRFDPTAKFISYPLWEIQQCAVAVESEIARLFPLCYQAFVANGRVAP